MLTSANARIVPTANATFGKDVPSSTFAYPPRLSDTAAIAIMFPNIHIHPPTKPANGERALFAYSYAPPSLATLMAILEKHIPVNMATMADTNIEIKIDGPASPIAMPIITNMPAPIIAPRFIITASNSVIVRFNPYMH
jgi:hypothetical protein